MKFDRLEPHISCFSQSPHYHHDYLAKVAIYKSKSAIVQLHDARDG
jgi:hypothetical protein